jgi:uncharacterized DUF497 family protein
VRIAFDPAKDAANIAKHGISLVRAADLEILSYVEDDRFQEPRYRLYGLIDGQPYCLATTRSTDPVRVISLRRAHQKEFRRHVR